MTKSKPEEPKPIRCAIYTRKSTEEGLDQDFNSLDAQREASESFIASQKQEGWVALPARYDDGGFSGGNLERPAMKRLVADIEAGLVDCVVVYKVDRLSRSLLDFARIMGTFDEKGVSFVSVTQQFNTTHSMGRLTLNILLSFAQFEREIIGERIRDKIAAQRRRGKWAGGIPVLGYDVDRSGPSPKLVVNAEEAARVRRIFAMYLEHESLMPVVHELERRDWRMKTWRTKSGKERGGRDFDKSSLHAMLTNTLYVGRIRHKTKTFAGQHQPIVEQSVFDQVQAMLRSHSNGRGKHVVNKYEALLRGLLYCPLCNRAMVHNVVRREAKIYRYYTCQTAIKRGRTKCGSPTLPAGEMEDAVVDHIRCIATDGELRRDVLQQSLCASELELEELELQQSQLRHQLQRHHDEIRRIATSADTESLNSVRLATLHEQIADVERSLASTLVNADVIRKERITELDVNAAFGDFDNVWSKLTTLEKSKVLQLLIERIEFDPTDSTIAITMHPSAIKSLTQTKSEGSDSLATSPKEPAQ